jgi:hypothetical protein
VFSLIVSLGLLAASGGLASAQPAAGSFPLRVEAPAVVGADAALGSVIAGRVAPNGNVYVADHVNSQIVAFSPEGRLLWRRGRKGRGPGEFQLPYRLDVRPDGTIVVYDMATSEVTTMSPDGRFLVRARLPFRFAQIDNLVSVSNTEFVAAGVLDLNTPTHRFGLHRFRITGQRVEHLGSFGPLPAVRDPVVLQHWGAGSIALGPGGSLLYVRRLPYEIYQYDRNGRETRMFRPAVALPGTADDFIRVERTATGMRVSATDTRNQKPGPLLDVGGGWVLASRVSNGPDFWDLYSPSGQPAGSRPIPEEWGGFLGYDPARSVIWMSGVRNDEPVLFRVRVSRGGGNQPTSRSKP